MVRDHLANEITERDDEVKVLELEKRALSKKIAYVLNNIKCIEREG